MQFEPLLRQSIFPNACSVAQNNTRRLCSIAFAPPASLLDIRLASYILGTTRRSIPSLLPTSYRPLVPKRYRSLTATTSLFSTVASARALAYPKPAALREFSSTAAARDADRDAGVDENGDRDDIDHNSDDMATKEKSSKAALQLKTPKGTRDWIGADMILRDEIFQTITDVFKRHGGTPLDTPVFELKDVLAGKYGEDARLIYDLADQGGELCALRYDLTVPFARFLAMNKVQQIKRYQIAKVYRRDQPAVARGRMREFYQCDLDIAGTYDRMIPDAEILRVVHEVFTALGQSIIIKINHRLILDGIFAVAGVPADKIRTISSSVDKLDKVPWEEARREMVDEKGLLPAVADQIGVYVKHCGDIPTVLALLRADDKLAANPDIRQGIDDMELLSSYLDAFGVPSTLVSFDLSLCRGLDYYTGLIFEVITQPSSGSDASVATAGTPKAKASSKKSEESQVGSIAAGGRYDNLVGMYGKTQIPCVGISFGVDRIYTIMKARREQEEAGKHRVRETDVYIMAFGGGGSFNGMLLERMKVARQLWDAGIKAEFAAKNKVRLPQQFKAAEDVPLAVILGEDEMAKGQVRLKVLGTGSGVGDNKAPADDKADKNDKEDKDDKDRGQLISQDDLVEAVKKLLI